MSMNAEFIQMLGRYPRCANAFEHGVYRRPVTEAVKHRHIQVNQPWRLDFLAFDIDRWGAAVAYEVAELPAPTLTMINPANGHCHVLYQLAEPVLMGRNARTMPQAFARDVAAGMTVQLAADPAYVGAFCKTPGHEAWQTITTGCRYELGELKEYLQVSVEEARATMKAVKADTDPNSRTLTLFNMLRRWAYKVVADYKPGTMDAFQKAVVLQAQAMVAREVRMALPGQPSLSASEYKHVAHSVARWVWATYKGHYMTAEAFSAKQQERIVKRWGDSTEVQAKAVELRKTTRLSHQAIADQLGVGRASVIRWTK